MNFNHIAKFHSWVPSLCNLLITLLSPNPSIWKSSIYSNAICMVNFNHVIILDMDSISLEQWVSLCWFNFIHITMSFFCCHPFDQCEFFFPFPIHMAQLSFIWFHPFEDFVDVIVLSRKLKNHPNVNSIFILQYLISSKFKINGDALFNHPTLIYNCRWI
jgi:hypothetical protein